MPNCRCLLTSFSILFRPRFWDDFLKVFFLDFNGFWSPKQLQKAKDVGPFWHQKSTLAPKAFPKLPLGSPWLVLVPTWLHFGRLGHPFGSILVASGTFWVPFWTILVASGTLPAPFWSLGHPSSSILVASGTLWAQFMSIMVKNS